jgi:hypothetical protein
MPRSALTLLCIPFFVLSISADDNWPQAAGPNGNWQVEGKPPTNWSVVRNEHIRWRTPMPEAGMSNVTVWGDRLFVTTHVPIEKLEEKEGVTDIIGFCLDSKNGEVLWQVELPGTSFIYRWHGVRTGHRWKACLVFQSLRLNGLLRLRR